MKWQLGEPIRDVVVLLSPLMIINTLTQSQNTPTMHKQEFNKGRQLQMIIQVKNGSTNYTKA